MSETLSNLPKSVLAKAVRSGLDRVSIAALAIGAGAGYHVGHDWLSAMLRSPEHYSMLTTGLTVSAPVVMSSLHAALGAMMTWAAIVAAQNYANIMKASAGNIAKERANDPGYVYQLPAWPGLINEKTGTRQLVLGEVHDLRGGYVPDPTWKILPELGWWTSFICFGATGTGKTASFCKTITEQMFELHSNDPKERVGGLVLDIKGDFANVVRSVAEQFGRSQDILAIRPGCDYRWNPIHSPESTPEVVAGWLTSVQENLTGGAGKDGAWVSRGVQQLAENVIGFLRLAKGYITLKDVNEFVQRCNADSGETNSTIDAMAPFVTMFRARESTKEEIESFALYSGWLQDTWAYYNQDNKGTVGNALLQITGPFTRPEAARTFCPDEKDLSFPGFEACIDRGWIVVLDAPRAKYGAINTALGIFLKLSFQRAALGRIARSKEDPSTNTSRPLLFLCDEYQNFATTTSENCLEGDDYFVPLSRESRCLNIVATQGPISLSAKVGEEKGRVILNSYRTKVFMAIEDAKDREWCADHVGKEWREIKSSSFNESVDAAKWSPLDGKMRGKKSTVSENVAFNRQLVHIVEPIEFKRLARFETIISEFDGDKSLPPTRCFLKTSFCPEPLRKIGYTPRTVPYKLLKQYMKEIGQ